MFTQDIIAKEVGVIIPPEDQRLFNVKMVVRKKLPKDRLSYGCWDCKIESFLKKHKIPLKTKDIYPSEINDVKKFLIENLKQANDMILSFNVACVARPETKMNYVHSAVVDSITIKTSKTIVTLGDPAYTSRKYFDIELEKLLDSMSSKYGKEKRFTVFYDT